MTPCNLRTLYDNVIDEVGFSDDWDEDTAWFLPLDWEGFCKQDGVELSMLADNRPVGDHAIYCVLRTTEPLAPPGDTKRMGVWYLYRESLREPKTLVAVARGEYDRDLQQMVIKRGSLGNLGMNFQHYFGFVSRVIRYQLAEHNT